MKTKTKEYLGLAGILLFIISWFIFVFLVGPQTIVDFLGVQNTYLTIFLISAIGGFSSFTAVSVYSLLVTFVGGGASPLFIALAAGFGVTIGDSLFYLFGSKSRDALNQKTKQKVDRLKKFIKNKNSFLTPVLIFIYAGFTPFPNDIMTVSVALTGYSYKKAITPLFLGNLTNLILVSYAAFYGWTLFGLK